MLALEIAKSNEAGLEQGMLLQLQGYLIGNAWREPNADLNERIPYAHGMALLSHEHFELAKSSCHGEYVNPSPNNTRCISALQHVKKCMDQVNIRHILEPNCNDYYLASDDFQFHKPSLLMKDDPTDLILLSKLEQPSCRIYNYVASYVWANDQTVQEALHVRKGKVADWRRFNFTVANEYDFDVQDVLKHHQLLNDRGFRALAYSGDHDMAVPYLSTLKWIRELNLTIDDEWRPWTVDGQVAGYTLRYKNSRDYLTFATVKGAGHTGAEYNPKECFAMVERWLSSFPL